MVLLVDSTNRDNIWKLRTLRAALGDTLHDPAFEVLCDFMGYFIYNDYGLASFLWECREGSNCAIKLKMATFSVELSAYTSIDCHLSSRIVELGISPFHICFRASADDIWKWLLNRGACQNYMWIGLHPKLIARLEMDSLHAGPASTDPAFVDLKIRISNELGDPDCIANILSQIRTAFRRAAGWPDYAL